MFVVYGNETGELGEFKTLKECQNAIKQANKFDIKEMGYHDVYQIFIEEDEE